MNNRKRMLEAGGEKIVLSVSTPSGLDPIDDYREVTFGLQDGSQRRAMFFLLPDKNSNDPYAVKPEGEWTVPVCWDDPTMLYVPTLKDESILAAITYILNQKLEASAFEVVDEI